MTTCETCGKMVFRRTQCKGCGALVCPACAKDDHNLIIGEEIMPCFLIYPTRSYGSLKDLTELENDGHLVSIRAA